jgi:hypothetical protein
MKDNQNRDLEAVKKWQAIATQAHDDGIARMLKAQEHTAYPEWTEVEGVKVLRIESSEFVAAKNGSTSAPESLSAKSARPTSASGYWPRRASSTNARPEPQSGQGDRMTKRPLFKCRRCTKEFERISDDDSSSYCPGCDAEYQEAMRAWEREAYAQMERESKRKQELDKEHYG